MAPFLTSLNYTSSNEDGNSELRALRLKHSDVVVSITGSGSRTLDLLLAGPARILSVDLNPCQNYLLELKLAALRTLQYPEFLEFLGVRIQKNRFDLYQQCRPLLSPAAAAYWDTNHHVLRRGVIYQGRWEKFFRRLAMVLAILRTRSVRRVFTFTSLADQIALFHHGWDGSLWRSFIRLVSSPLVWRHSLGDPGFFQHVPVAFPTGDYILERFDEAFHSRVFARSPFMSLLLRGRYDEAALPPHLMQDNFLTLRTHSNRVVPATAPLDEFLEAQTAVSVNAFSLSDIASYTDTETYGRIWRSIVRTAAPGASVCERQFLVRRDPPVAGSRSFVRRRKLESALNRDDDAAFYSFVVGTLQ